MNLSSIAFVRNSYAYSIKIYVIPCEPYLFVQGHPSTMDRSRGGGRGNSAGTNGGRNNSIRTNRGHGTTKRRRGNNQANLHSIDRRGYLTRSRVRNLVQGVSTVTGTNPENAVQEAPQALQVEQQKFQHEGTQPQQVEVQQIGTDDLLQGNFNVT